MMSASETVRKALLGTCRVFKSKIGSPEEHQIAGEFEEVIREFPSSPVERLGKDERAVLAKLSRHICSDGASKAMIERTEKRILRSLLSEALFAAEEALDGGEGLSLHQLRLAPARGLSRRMESIYVEQEIQNLLENADRLARTMPDE